MNRDEETIAGNTYSHRITENGTLSNITAKAQEINKQLGYGDDSKEWRKRPYNITKRMLQQQARIEALNKMRKALNMPTLGAK